VGRFSFSSVAGFPFYNRGQQFPPLILAGHYKYLPQNVEFQKKISSGRMFFGQNAPDSQPEEEWSLYEIT